jgi:hypothetical protein
MFEDAGKFQWIAGNDAEFAKRISVGASREIRSGEQGSR